MSEVTLAASRRPNAGPPQKKTSDEQAQAPAPKVDPALNLQRDSFDAPTTQARSKQEARARAVDTFQEARPAAQAQQKLERAKELQDYAQQKIQELEAAKQQVPQTLSNAKAAADRNVTAATQAVEGKSSMRPAAADRSLLENLERAHQLDAVNALNRGDKTNAAPTPASPSTDETERRRIAGLTIDSERTNRVIDLMARRSGRDPARLTEAERDRLYERAQRLSRILGQGNSNLGMYVLENALRSGRLHVGLAGINGPGGGPRGPAGLEQTRRDMGSAVRGEVDAVLDNDHGALQAFGADPHRQQVQDLTELTRAMNELNVRVDVTAHSNGFNALAAVARGTRPPVRFGHVNLVNPNVPGSLSRTERDMRAIVERSQRVSLTTTINDEAIPLSSAGVRNGGNGWMNQITAAVRAGVHDIRVFLNAGHGLEDVGQSWNRESPRLDFQPNRQTGRMEPRDPDAWRRDTGFRWTGNGFVYDPLPVPLRPPRRAAA